MTALSSWDSTLTCPSGAVSVSELRPPRAPAVCCRVTPDVDAAQKLGTVVLAGVQNALRRLPGYEAARGAGCCPPAGGGTVPWLAVLSGHRSPRGLCAVLGAAV